MTERPEIPEAPTGARGGKLPSAREQVGSDPRRRPVAGKPRRAAGGGRPRNARPTPARDDRDEAGAVRAPPADEAEAVLSIDDARWTVRVLGRSGGRRAGVAAPLLLLGFWAPGAAEGPPGRETLVVGRTLAALSDAELRHAYDRSEPRAPGVAER